MNFITRTPIIISTKTREEAGMGHIFSHVTRSDRITIEAMLKAGSSRKEIAEKIGVRSTGKKSGDATSIQTVI